MTKRLAALIATAILVVLAGGWAAQANGQEYPYTLIDPGTFGGPSNFPNYPGIPFTSDGTLLGSADTSTPDSSYLICGENLCDGFQQHAFAWRDGKLTDLGVLPGTTGSTVYQLNGHGVAAGGAETGTSPGSTSVAVLFAHGQVISLGTLPGGSQAFAQNINHHGQVAGLSSNGIADPFSLLGWGTETRSFVWRKGVMQDLGGLGGPDTQMIWQNARGQITGLSSTNATPNPANGGFPSVHPFLWQNGHITDLGTLGGTVASPNWMNDAGQVVGLANLPRDENAHPFLWQNGTMIDLGTPSGDFGMASDINQRGDTAGAYVAADGNFHGILWRGHQMIDLPPVGVAPWAFGQAVNDLNQVVGTEVVPNFNDNSFPQVLAPLWSRGHVYDLNTLVTPNPLQMTSAIYIDDRGDIVGHGFMPDGTQRMFLLIRNPSVPLPATSTSDHATPRTRPESLNATSLLAPRATGRSSSAAEAIRWFLLDRRR